MKDARILVAADIAADTEWVRKLLQNEFANVCVSISPDEAVGDFERCMPEVLILAFNSLEKAERYYLGLYRLSTKVISVAHRTIILCGTKELQRVHELCRKGYFDDYVLFWPMTNDAQRLPMAVTHALRDLEHSNNDQPRLRKLNDALQATEQRVGEGGGEGGGEGASKWASKWASKRASELKRQPAPQRGSLPAPATPVNHFRPLVLVVDDDEFARKLAGKLLSEAPYDLLFASSGAEALNLTRERRPDLILMDMVMPEISGLETLRKLKASHQSADIPVMMITGQSEKDLVVECLKAGAVDFVLKPANREMLLKKVARVLSG